MANGVGFEGANHVMEAPEGVPQDECVDLPVFADGQQVISCWRLSEDEIEHIRETGVIWLSVQGGGMPPVAIAAKGLVFIDGRDPVAEPYTAPAPRTVKGEE